MTKYEWKERSYVIDPEADNLIRFEWYYPETDDGIARVVLRLENCPTSMLMQIRAVAIGQYMPDVENSKLSVKPVRLYPFGSPSGGYMYAYLTSSEEHVVVENVLSITVLSALLYKFSGNMYELKFYVENKGPRGIYARLCLGSTCSSKAYIPSYGRNVIKLYISPYDIIPYYEILRNVPLVIEIEKSRGASHEVIISPANTPIEIIGRPMAIVSPEDEEEAGAYTCTSTFRDGSTYWKDQLQIRGGAYIVYIIKPNPRDLGCAMIKTAYSSLDELDKGSITTNLDVSIYFYGLCSELHKVVLDTLRIRVSNIGILGRTDTKVLIYGGGDNVPELKEIPPVSTIISLINVPIVSQFLTVYNFFANIWNKYLRYTVCNDVSSSIGNDYVELYFKSALLNKPENISISFTISYVKIKRGDSKIVVIPVDISTMMSTSKIAIAIMDVFRDKLVVSDMR